MPFFYYFDPTYILVVIGLLITVWAQISVQSTFNKYSRVRISRGLTGADAARQVLSGGKVSGVSIKSIRGSMTDHYDPRDNSISLSETVAGVSTAAAIGVAAHEAGHALQHAEGYGPIKLRMAIIPVCNFASGLAMPLFLLGILFSAWNPETGIGYFMMQAGIIAFSVAVFFQVVTLPVEFNASRRAMAALEASGAYTDEELDGARRVLRAAAMTYVAALAVSLLQILRLVILSGGNRRR
ncbi:MAG: zinc metallopeptidase [Clostridia bacterium]|nr:zinc metallopeptidase [Clostridia bacterium]